MNLIYNKTGKDYGNGILNFAHRYPIVGLIVLPILFDWPAKAIQAGVRTAKYGDPRLGNAPLAMEMEGQTGASGISLFGNLTKQGGHFDEGPQFPPRGDMYRDTSHLNSAKAGPMYGESGFYRDTRNLAPSRPTPGAYSEGGFLDAKGKGPKPDNRPSYSKANQQLVDIVGGGSVFQGISGLGRVRR
tara:strand:- start:22 stop:582 length:561 start_codon:yes stop_codon:yes gene_type:complete